LRSITPRNTSRCSLVGSRSIRSRAAPMAACPESSRDCSPEI
jgi:hypothetical protein